MCLFLFLLYWSFKNQPWLKSPVYHRSIFFFARAYCQQWCISSTLKKLSSSKPFLFILFPHPFSRLSQQSVFDGLLARTMRVWPPSAKTRFGVDVELYFFEQKLLWASIFRSLHPNKTGEPPRGTFWGVLSWFLQSDLSNSSYFKFLHVQVTLWICPILGGTSTFDAGSGGRNYNI